MSGGYGDRHFARLWGAGTSVSDIADSLDMTYRQVVDRAARLGLPPRKTPSRSTRSWNSERVAQLAEMWGRGASIQEVADQLGGVSRDAVASKIGRMGLRRKNATRPVT